MSWGQMSAQNEIARLIQMSSAIHKREWHLTSKDLGAHEPSAKSPSSTRQRMEKPEGYGGSSLDKLDHAREYREEKEKVPHQVKARYP